MVACSDDEAKTVKITKEAFKEGMTIEEVKDVVGGEPREVLGPDETMRM